RGPSSSLVASPVLGAFSVASSYAALPRFGLGRTSAHRHVPSDSRAQRTAPRARGPHCRDPSVTTLGLAGSGGCRRLTPRPGTYLVATDPAWVLRGFEGPPSPRKEVGWVRRTA